MTSTLAESTPPTMSQRPGTGDDAAAASEVDAVPWARRLGLDTAYVATALPLGVVGFVVVLTGLALGLGLLVVWAGLAVLTGTVLAARALAHLERGRLRTLQLRGAATPAYLTAPPGARPIRRVLTPLRDAQSWLDALWGLAGFVTGLTAFVVVVSWWATALGGVTYWFWQQWLPDDNVGLVQLVGFGDSTLLESLLNLLAGLFFAVTLPAVTRVSALAHAGLASALLCGRAELQQEVQRVEEGRSAARVAEAASLRRLERDIHDGPQQRLTRLALDLGRARHQLDQEDPRRAAETLDAALAQTRATVEELRALSRGIAPPLLVDRGLRVALEELLDRSVVPARARLELPEHLAPHVETAVYFVVSEALTNVAKHSGARSVAVSVVVEDGSVVVRVEDDGVGGAHLAKGAGLAGLEQRLAGADGTLRVDSPSGGPTTLCAEIPL